MHTYVFSQLVIDQSNTDPESKKFLPGGGSFNQSHVLFMSLVSMNDFVCRGATGDLRPTIGIFLRFVNTCNIK